MIGARLGKVTGRGLAGVLRCNYPRWILWSACFLLIVANIFNIGADLGGMADVTKMMTGVSSRFSKFKEIQNSGLLNLTGPVYRLSLKLPQMCLGLRMAQAR